MEHTTGKLQLWTSNSWRRFGTDSWRRFGTDQGKLVCEPITQPDGHPDLHFPNGGEDGPDARRLVACWNACENVPTDKLSDGCLLKLGVEQEADVVRLERDLSTAEALLREINTLACYASEEDTESRYATLLEIGKKARLFLSRSK